MKKVSTFCIHDQLEVVYEYNPDIFMFSFDLFTTRGQYGEHKDLQGITHLIASVLDRGCQKYQDAHLRQWIHRFQIDYDAIMGNHYIGLEFHCPSKNFKEVLGFAKEAFMHPLFDQKHIDQERSIILQEIEKLPDDPDEVIARSFFSKVFGAHPYARHAWGNKVCVEGISRKDMMAYYDYLLGGKWHLNMVGSIDPDQIHTYLNKLFQTVQKNSSPPHEQNIHIQTDTTASVVQTQFSKLYGALGFLLCPAKHPDRHVLEWIRNYWVNGSGGVLFEKIREQRGLVYHIDCQNSFLRQAGCMLISYSSDPQVASEIDMLISEEIQNLMQGNITQDMINQVNQYIQGASILEWDPTSHHIQFYNQAVINETTLDYQQEREKILSVRPEDIKRVSQKYFDQKNRVEVKLVP